MIAVREEVPADAAAIADVVRRAFVKAEHSDQTEPAIVERLRDAGALTISLVAEEDGELVGHVAMSPVLIGGHDFGWFGLGPVAVNPDRQGKGIGSTLVHAGLDRLRALGAAGCVVLGEPDYYGRFGFAADEKLRFVDAPAEYFMALNLAGDNPVSGIVDYHPAFLGN